jgi:hypothetical protein
MGAASASVSRGEPPLPPEWAIRFEPMIWAPALRGDLTVNGGAVIDVENVDADENEIAPAGTLTIRADQWSFQFRGFGFNVDEPAATIDLFGFDGTVGYRLPMVIDDPDREVRLGFDIFGGVRVHSLDLSVGAAQTDDVWAEPIVGGRMAIDLPHGFGLDLSASGGGLPSGEDSSFSWDITVAFSWMFAENAGLEIGFRHLQMDLLEGDGADESEFDAALAGLFGAVVIRF